MEVEQKNPKQQNTHAPYNRFFYALKASESQRQYPKRLEVFLNFIKIDGLNLQEKLYNLYHKSKSNTQWLQDSLIDFIMFQKERVSKGEIVYSTIPNYYKAIKLFCDMNDIVVNWKLVTRGMPRGNHAANDRAPTIEEIKKLLEYPDRRIKAIVYTIISSGIRLGAWDYLRWGHICPIIKDGEVIAERIIVYAGEDDEYFRYISKEALDALQSWLRYREESGELIDDNSWLMRDL